MSADVVYRVSIAKQHLADALGVSSSLLHIPVGLVLLLAFGLGFCGSARRWPLSLVGVCAIQVANEILDAVQWVRWTGEVNWAEAVLDTALTLCTPVLVVVVVELRRGRIGPAGAS